MFSYISHKMSKKSATKKTTKDGVGNTKTTPPKESKAWFFTYNNCTEDQKDQLIEYFKGKKKCSYICQFEIGEEEGTRHLQGCFKALSATKFKTLKNKFIKVHWEACRSWENSGRYCCKEDTRDSEAFCSPDMKVLVRATIIDPLAGKELYEYQKYILKLLKKKPHERKVYWFWEEHGNVGKSALVKHIYLNNKDHTVIAGGKGNDVRNQINLHVNGNEAKKIHGKDLNIAILDISRTNEDYVSYEVIEQIKNGLLYSGKYEGGICCFNSPHVIIFANFKPKEETLSADRWVIKEIGEDGELL